MSSRFGLEAARHLIEHQDGVVARRQLLDLGAGDHDIERLLRWNHLSAVHPGVYVAHTGGLSRTQRQWAAVLSCWPATLTGVSALPAEVVRELRWVRSAPTVQVAVTRDRRPRPPDGVTVHRRADLAERVAWNQRPPRLQIEHVAIELASGLLVEGRVASAFELLARVVNTRMTTTARVVDALASRPRIAERAALSQLLEDLGNGACSVLERGFVQLIERPHGLPSAHRQRRRRPDGRTTYVDADYDPFGLLVELDGRAFHDAPSTRDRDAARDLANLADGAGATVRLTYGLVFDTPCRTAVHLARLLRLGGWSGAPATCSTCREAA